MIRGPEGIPATRWRRRIFVPSRARDYERWKGCRMARLQGCRKAEIVACNWPEVACEPIGPPMATAVTPTISIVGPRTRFSDRILTPEALDFVARLQHEFGGRRLELLERRKARL